MVKAQDRINENIYTFQQSSDLITNIVGWVYNNEGQWVSNENFICQTKDSYMNDKRFSKSANSIQVKSFIYNDEIKYVLIISFNGGHYRYPELKIEWIDYTEYMVFSLTSEQINSIFNITEYMSFILPCMTYNNYFGQKSENWVIRQIIEYEKNFYESEKNTRFSFMLSHYGQKITIKKWKDVIRFCYFEIDDSKYNDVLMEESYFEIPINEWDKLNIID
jgi:hypothetical protein